VIDRFKAITITKYKMLYYFFLSFIFCGLLGSGLVYIVENIIENNYNNNYNKRIRTYSEFIADEV
jgi:hypothetical protein